MSAWKSRWSRVRLVKIAVSKPMPRTPSSSSAWEEASMAPLSTAALPISPRRPSGAIHSGVVGGAGEDHVVLFDLPRTVREPRDRASQFSLRLSRLARLQELAQLHRRQPCRFKVSVAFLPQTAPGAGDCLTT